MQIWATDPPNIEKIREGVGEIWHPKWQNSGTRVDNTHKMTNSSSTNNPNPTILGLMESSLEGL